MLSMRGTIILCLLTLLLAVWTCWTFATAGMVPSFWVASPALAPQFVAGFATALAALAAPLIFSRDEIKLDGVALHILKATLAAMWLAVAAAFMMLTASRVAPVEGAGIAQASLWIFFTAWFSTVLNRATPRFANAILFFWFLALPISAYMVAEVFLMSPAGGSGLADSTAPQAAALRTAVRWSLNLSPGTATLGALTGMLADGSPYSFAVPALALTVLATALSAFTLRAEKRAVGFLNAPSVSL